MSNRCRGRAALSYASLVFLTLAQQSLSREQPTFSDLLALEKFTDEFIVSDAGADDSRHNTLKYTLTLDNPIQQAKELTKLPAAKGALDKNPDLAGAMDWFVKEHDQHTKSISVDVYTNGRDAVGVGCASCAAGRAISARRIKTIPNLGKIMDSVRESSSTAGPLSISKPLSFSSNELDSGMPDSVKSWTLGKPISKQDYLMFVAENMERAPQVCNNGEWEDKDSGKCKKRSKDDYDEYSGYGPNFKGFIKGAFVDRDEDSVLHEHQVLCWWELPTVRLTKNILNPLSTGDYNGAKVGDMIPNNGNTKDGGVAMIGSNSWRCRWRYMANMVTSALYNMVLTLCVVLLSGWTLTRMFCRIFSHLFTSEKGNACIGWGLTLTEETKATADGGTKTVKRVSPPEVESLLTDVGVFIAAIWAFRKAIVSGDLVDLKDAQQLQKEAKLTKSKQEELAVLKDLTETMKGVTASPAPKAAGEAASGPTSAAPSSAAPQPSLASTITN